MDAFFVANARMRQGGGVPVGYVNDIKRTYGKAHDTSAFNRALNFRADELQRYKCMEVNNSMLSQELSKTSDLLHHLTNEYNQLKLLIDSPLSSDLSAKNARADDSSGSGSGTAIQTLQDQGSTHRDGDTGSGRNEASVRGHASEHSAEGRQEGSDDTVTPVAPDVAAVPPGGE